MLYLSVYNTFEMAKIKSPEKKTILVKEHKVSKKAPVWVFAKTKRKIRGSPKSNRSWRHDSIF